MIELVFWIAAVLLAYTWVGYPAALGLIGRGRRIDMMGGRDGPRFDHRGGTDPSPHTPRHRGGTDPSPHPPRPPMRSHAPRRSRGAARDRDSLFTGALPRLSVVVAAYNEAGCIGGKIRSTLEQRYPWDRLELIVVSDGSTDGTDDVVARYPDPRVRLIRQEPRSGKSVALNRGVAAANGDVVVFTDANAMFTAGSLARLAAPFADSHVGLVSGQGLYAAGPGDPRAVSNGYVRYEAFLRSAEAGLGSIAGADGAVYALRRGLYQPLEGAQINDLLHPIQAALAGFDSRFVPDAVTVEPPSRGGAHEFRRHVRIIAQCVHIVGQWLPALVRAGRWREAWMLASHRALRWTTAPLLGVVLVANAALAPSSIVYAAAFAAQVGFYLLAGAGLLAERVGRRIGALAIPYYFCVVAAAGIAGLVRFSRTGAESTWAVHRVGGPDMAPQPQGRPLMGGLDGPPKPPTSSATLGAPLATRATVTERTA